LSSSHVVFLARCLAASLDYDMNDEPNLRRQHK